MGTVILLLLVAGFVGLGTYYYMQAEKNDDGSNTLPDNQSAGQLESDLGMDRSLLELKLDDIVSYYGTDYMVEGRVQYRQDSWTWVEYMLEDSGDVRWLEAEEDGGMQATLWKEVDDLPITGEPGEFIEYDGEEFTLSEHGRAQAQQEGRTGKKQGMEVEYYEYNGPGDRLLAVEKWGGDTEVSVGESIEPYELDVLPGS